jgi:IPT/TIG domain
MKVANLRCRRLVSALLFVLFSPSLTSAEISAGKSTGLAGAVFNGPSSYLSFADSPFAGLAFEYFFLEDFEDGQLDTPGVSKSTGGVGPPGPFADSVDADDGAIDGNGNGGSALFSHLSQGFTFTFDAATLGHLPTHAGVVWTDAESPRTTSVFLESFDANGLSSGLFGPFTVGDNTTSGTTLEDRFLGVVDQGGISAIRIFHQAAQIEVDHLQYGWMPPCEGEPCILGLFPSSGGDTGSVTVTIATSGLDLSGPPVVKLSRDGESEIFGRLVSLEEEDITVQFDLSGRQIGRWDLVVVDASSTEARLLKVFTVEEGRAGEVWVDLLGPSRLRVDRDQQFWIMVGNRGNVDSSFTDVWFEIPPPIKYLLPIDPGVPPEGDSPPDEPQFTIAVPPLAPDTVRAIPLTLTLAQTGSFAIRAQVRPPLSDATSFGQAAGGLNLLADSCDCDDSVSVEYPARWDWRTKGAPPPDYIVLYKDAGGNVPSIAVSLGDGNVSHFMPNHESYNFVQNLADGLNVHPYKVVLSNKIVEPFAILRPPCWSPQSAATNVDYFRANYQPNDPEAGMSSYEGLATVYKPEKASAKTFPVTNCGGWAAYAVKCLKRAISPLTLEATGKLYIDLCSYWQEPCVWEEINRITGRHVVYANFTVTITGVASSDPNEKIGSEGHGAAQFLTGNSPWPYLVRFENLSSATAPAQEVVVSDELSSNLDAETISLGPIRVGGRQIIPPPNSGFFLTTVDLRPEHNLLLRIQSTFDPITRRLTWRFMSLDPVTGLPPEDPLAGFLPPNIHPPEGEGSVLFTVLPKEGLSTGTEIRNRATITFDTNAPIETQEWFNTLDSTNPLSQVLPLASTQTELDFVVQWSGTDVGSAVRSYDLWVSEDSGPFKPWLTDTTDISATFHAVSGKTYAYYSVARDWTGNIEKTPSVPDSTTQVAILSPIVRSISPNTGSTEGGTPVTIIGSGFASGATLQIGEITATNIEVVNATTITAITVPHSTGAADVTATNQDGLSATLTRSFFYSPPPVGLDFFTLTPCRIIDTRRVEGQLGGPALAPSQERFFTVTETCGIPPSAKALVVNLTVVSPTGTGYLSVYPGNAFFLGTSMINFSGGKTRATNGIVLLSTDGAGSIGIMNSSGGSAHVALDVSGFLE